MKDLRKKEDVSSFSFNNIMSGIEDQMSDEE